MVSTIKLLEHSMKKNCRKQASKFTIENVIKIKCDKLYFKWKGYDN